MAWLENIFGTTLSMGVKLTILFVALVIALLIIVWVARRIFGNSSATRARNRQPRLSVTDAAVVDDKRRLVLVRRDHVEHLVMIGGPSDIVIEQNIQRAAAHPPANQIPNQIAAAHPAPTAPHPVQPEPAEAPAPAAAPETRPAAPIAAATAATGAVTGLAATGAEAASGAAEKVSDFTASAAERIGETARSTASDAAAGASQSAEAVKSSLSGLDDSTSHAVDEIGEELVHDLEEVFAPAKQAKPSVESEPAASAVQHGADTAMPVPDISAEREQAAAPSVQDGGGRTEPVMDAPSGQSPDEGASSEQEDEAGKDEMQRLLDDLTAGR